VAERSKTKTKILKTALALFNNEGESAVSSVDIASVIGISPGNLYYHYKGKDEIIVELFADFEEEIRQVLSSPVREPLRLEDNWVYLYIIFEEIYDFRFFYKNQSFIKTNQNSSTASLLCAINSRVSYPKIPHRPRRLHDADTNHALLDAWSGICGIVKGFCG